MADTATKTKASPNKGHKVTPEVQKARAASAAANRAPINFGVSLTSDEIAAQQAVERSAWVQRLEELYEAVVNPESPAAYDALYQIGTFKTTTGARTVFNSIEKRVLPREYLLETRLVGAGASRHSELWAGVPAPDEDGAA